MRPWRHISTVGLSDRERLAAACDAAKNLQTAENGLQVLDGITGGRDLILFFVVVAVMVTVAAISAATATAVAVVAATSAVAAALAALAENFV